jgi:large conductance mechanosensitive channel
VIKPAVVDTATGKETAPLVAVKFGLFLNSIIEFLIVAFTVFCVVKAMNKIVNNGLLPNPFRKPAPPAPPAA